MILEVEGLFTLSGLEFLFGIIGHLFGFFLPPLFDVVLSPFVFTQSAWLPPPALGKIVALWAFFDN